MESRNKLLWCLVSLTARTLDPQELHQHIHFRVKTVLVGSCQETDFSVSLLWRKRVASISLPAQSNIVVKEDCTRVGSSFVSTVMRTQLVNSPSRGCGEDVARQKEGLHLPVPQGVPGDTKSPSASLAALRTLALCFTSEDERYFSGYFSFCQGNRYKQTRTGKMKGLLKITFAHM